MAYSDFCALSALPGKLKVLWGQLSRRTGSLLVSLHVKELHRTFAPLHSNAHRTAVCAPHSNAYHRIIHNPVWLYEG